MQARPDFNIVDRTRCRGTNCYCTAIRVRCLFVIIAPTKMARSFCDVTVTTAHNIAACIYAVSLQKVHQARLATD